MTASVFITGGSGLLALNWALAIRDSHPVTLGLHERQISLHGVQAIRVDVESVDHLVRTLDEAQISIVVHAAGFTNVEECEAKPELARHIMSILRATWLRHVPRLVCRWCIYRQTIFIQARNLC